MWKFKNDNTPAIINAEKHIASSHSNKIDKLPKTAILFFMRGGIEYTTKHYKTKKISNHFPRFLNSCPIYKINNSDICFLHGGYGAPQAVDTIETLAALDFKNIITIGMFGTFSSNVNSGDILIPNKAFSEEGTSLHYYENAEFFEPDAMLLKKATEFMNNSYYFPIVSTDAVYRQTFFKEELWRSKGAIGVDMETSAIYSVSKYLGLNSISILIASDKHPLNENEKSWKWTMTEKQRKDLFKKCIDFALTL